MVVCLVSQVIVKATTGFRAVQPEPQVVFEDGGGEGERGVGSGVLEW